MYSYKCIPVLINEFWYTKKLSFISKSLLDESVHLNFRRPLSIFSQMGADDAFHYLQFGHRQMGNGSNPLRSHMFAPSGELKGERIDLILITARAAMWKVDFSQDLKIFILIKAESDLEVEYNRVALDMHFYFFVMGAFYCCLFAVQQLLQHFPGLLFPQLVSALPFLPLLTDIMGSVFCCNLLQHLLSCRPALLCWSGSWFGLLAVLSVTPAAACLQPLLFSSRFPDPFADTHSLLWTYLVLT